MKIAFVTNICAHYRVRTFEILAEKLDVDYYFFSAGNEWYWQQEHGINSGSFEFQYLSGFSIGNTRITLRLPWKLYFNNYDVYIKCINGKFALPLTYLVARLRGKPFILWTGIWMRLQTLSHKFIYPLTKFIYNHADAIVVYGDHVKDFLIEEGVSSVRIFIANHAIDNNSYNQKISKEEKSNLLEELEIDTGNKIILYLGRLEVSKGIEYLIEAFSEINRIEDTTLVIAGTGTEENSLKSLVNELEINDHVRFLGYIHNESVKLYYSISQVVVLPSITMPSGKEPWGLVINEVFNQGVPVIVSDAVGAAAGGLVEDSVNGYIVPERDSSAITSALIRILDDDELREFLGNNAKSKISYWDNKLMVSGFLNAIDYVIANK